MSNFRSTSRNAFSMPVPAVIHVNQFDTISYGISGDFDQKSSQTDDCIPILPEFHPLCSKRLSRICDVSDVDDVMNLVMDFLRVNSIRADHKSSQATLLCTTQECLKFSIQLWKLEPGGSEVLLEVQRRSGCSVMMNLVRRALFSTLDHGRTVRIQKSLSFRPGSLVRQMYNARTSHAVHASCHLPMIRKPQRQISESSADSLEIVLTLLEGDGIQDIQLGCETLSALTNKRQTTPKLSQSIAAKVVCKTNGCSSRLQHALEDHIWSSVHDQDWTDANRMEITVPLFRAVAQSLNICDAEPDWSDSAVDQTSSFWPSLIGASIAFLSQPRRFHILASLSARILASCITMEVNSDLRESDKLLALACNALEVGKAVDLALEQESQRLIDAIMDQVDGSES